MNGQLNKEEERARVFLNSLYQEKENYKTNRHDFVKSKILYTTTLFGLGNIKLGVPDGDASIPVDLLFLLYIAPYVAMVFDFYIFAEHYKVRRIGVWIREECQEACSLEKEWESWVDKKREGSAALASLALTVFAAGICYFILKHKEPSTWLNYWLAATSFFILVLFLFRQFLNWKMEEKTFSGRAGLWDWINSFFNH